MKAINSKGVELEIESVGCCDFCQRKPLGKPGHLSVENLSTCISSGEFWVGSKESAGTKSIEVYSEICLDCVRSFAQSINPATNPPPLTAKPKQEPGNSELETRLERLEQGQKAKAGAISMLTEIAIETSTLPQEIKDALIKFSKKG